MARAENGLEFPQRLTDETLLDVAFEGHFRECFGRLGLQTVGELRQAPQGSLSFGESGALNAWLLRCWWFW